MKFFWKFDLFLKIWSVFENLKCFWKFEIFLILKIWNFFLKIWNYFEDLKFFWNLKFFWKFEKFLKIWNFFGNSKFFLKIRNFLENFKCFSFELNLPLFFWSLEFPLFNPGRPYGLAALHGRNSSIPAPWPVRLHCFGGSLQSRPTSGGSLFFRPTAGRRLATITHTHTKRILEKKKNHLCNPSTSRALGATNQQK